MLDLAREEVKALVEMFKQGVEDPSELDQNFFLRDDDNPK